MDGRLSAFIPCINIKKEKPININKEIIKQFKNKAEELNKFDSSEKTDYSVSYISYLQNNILSLVIRAELFERGKNQRIIIKTFNYNIVEDREVSLEEFLKMKNIKQETAEKKIRSEIKEIQKENDTIEQIVNQTLGGDEKIYKRDYNSDIYKISNTKEYFLGKDGMIYLLYAYGNNDNTDALDVVIFK